MKVGPEGATIAARGEEGPGCTPRETMKDWPQKLVWYLQYLAVRAVEMLLQCFPIEDNLQAASLDVAEYLAKPLFIREFCRVVRITLSQSAASHGMQQGMNGEDDYDYLAAS